MCWKLNPAPSLQHSSTNPCEWGCQELWYQHNTEILGLSMLKMRDMDFSSKLLMHVWVSETKWLHFTVMFYNHNGICRFEPCLCGWWKDYTQETKAPFSSTKTGALWGNHISLLSKSTELGWRVNRNWSAERQIKCGLLGQTMGQIQPEHWSNLSNKILLVAWLIFPLFDIAFESNLWWKE